MGRGQGGAGRALKAVKAARAAGAGGGAGGAAGQAAEGGAAPRYVTNEKGERVMSVTFNKETNRISRTNMKHKMDDLEERYVNASVRQKSEAYKKENGKEASKRQINKFKKEASSDFQKAIEKKSKISRMDNYVNGVVNQKVNQLKKAGKEATKSQISKFTRDAKASFNKNVTEGKNVSRLDRLKINLTNRAKDMNAKITQMEKSGNFGGTLFRGNRSKGNGKTFAQLSGTSESKDLRFVNKNKSSTGQRRETRQQEFTRKLGLTNDGTYDRQKEERALSRGDHLRGAARSAFLDYSGESRRAYARAYMEGGAKAANNVTLQRTDRGRKRAEYRNNKAAAAEVERTKKTSIIATRDVYGDTVKAGTLIKRAAQVSNGSYKQKFKIYGPAEPPAKSASKSKSKATPKARATATPSTATPKVRAQAKKTSKSTATLSTETPVARTKSKSTAGGSRSSSGRRRA